MGPNSFNWTSFLGTLDQRDNNISTVVLDWRLIDGSAEQHVWQWIYVHELIHVNSLMIKYVL